ncbi:DNA-binding response regulator [Campylobacterota bacterium]|nr:DNA-binding response regulator [Campylobacterota bacterium]
MKQLVVAASSSERNKIIAKELSQAHYQVAQTLTIDECLAAIEETQADLALVDWSVAKETISTFSLDIKRGLKQVSLIILSDHYDKDDLIYALNKGADDYCVIDCAEGEIDPFYFDLLVSRIEARLRFGGTNVIDVGQLVIDPDEEKIYYLEREIELKGKPFEVMTHLARHRDVIISKEQLLDAIWEEPELVTPNVIEVAINQIRQKIDKPLGINTIETVRRRGYRFCFPNCSGQTITDR